LQTGFLTVAVLPVRVICIAILLAAAWLLACVGLIGVSEDDMRKIPLTGWRRYMV
jgi:lysophosphatidylcholine acyltransferase / lyso-PAF acetyltransferase